jgi:pyruvate carboxylase subunit A
VQEQIRIADGPAAAIQQEDIRYRGFAMEFRINAEDPKNSFLPSFGRITRYYAPGGPGVRTDAAMYSGYTIPPYYDSMCAKLTVWALNWEAVIERGRRALDDMKVYGVKTTIPYYQEILLNPDFPHRPLQHRLRRRPPGTPQLRGQPPPRARGRGALRGHRRPPRHLNGRNKETR